MALSLLSVRAKKYYQRTGKKIFINANDTAGYDKSKVECYNCHNLETALPGSCRSTKKQGTATYKRGLATVEAQLITYRKNEVLFSEEVAVLKREVACKDYEINVLKSEKCPPPHLLIYNRPKKLDLSYSGLDEFKEPEFKGYGPENSEQESNVVCDKESDNSKENSDESLVEEQVSQDKSSFVESLLNVDKETVFPVNKNVELATHDDKVFVNSGCLRHMTGNILISQISRNFDGGYLHLEEMCDKKNYILFTDTEWLVLSPNFKLPDENQILLKIPRKDNMYSFDIKNIVLKGSLTCLVAKATLDESMLWHRRLGCKRIAYKTF
ncbi:hypothetical protein Tco_1049480 [Tanacetum coccineum]